jgi:hypothetical protein
MKPFLKNRRITHNGNTTDNDLGVTALALIKSMGYVAITLITPKIPIRLVVGYRER